MRTRKSMHGVTLIELMIVVVVLALLASIAVPSYRRYMIRTNRTEATAALLQIQQAQEKFFIQNGRYALAAEQTAAPPAGLGLPAVTPSGNYTITVVDGGTPTQYSATAVPVAGEGQADDGECTNFTINETGSKSSSPSTTHCWR